MSQNNPHFSCPACGRKFPWKAESAGRKGKCKCGAVLTVPAEPARVADPELGALEDAAASEATASPAGCPGCGQPMEPGAVLCLNCGYNVRTGGQVATEIGAGQAQATATTAKAGRSEEATYPGRRRRGPVEKEPAASTKMYLILGGALLVVAMGVGGWIVFQGTGGGKANVPRLGDDAKVERMIEVETATDLSKWINANPARMLSGRTRSQALGMEERLKGLGAKRVLAFGVGVMCMSVAIELPTDPAQRLELFNWYDRDKPPSEPRTKDVGQRYLLYFTGL